jgi:hypothetical protein
MAIRKRLDGRCRQFTGFRELGAAELHTARLRCGQGGLSALVRVAIIARSFSASAAKGEG